MMTIWAFLEAMISCPAVQAKAQAEIGKAVDRRSYLVS